MRHIFTQNVLRREVFGSRVKGNQKLLCNIFCLFISTLNIMDGVLCSARVSERLKIRKSLGIHHWKDTISSVDVNNNVININKLWEVSTSFVILYYFLLQHYFFLIMKNRTYQKSRGLQPPPVFTGLRWNSISFLETIRYKNPEFFCVHWLSYVLQITFQIRNFETLLVKLFGGFPLVCVPYIFAVEEHPN